MTVSAIVAAMVIAAIFGVVAIRDLGYSSSNESLLLLCEVGEKNLDAYFESVEQSVEMVSAYVEQDLEGLDGQRLQEHLDRASEIFKNMNFSNSGVLTYYYRIDPEVSTNAKGFWYVNLDGEGFVEHEVTDITLYDTQDTSSLVWFTVPKATGQSVWLPPYITDNLDARVISYNEPIYFAGHFVGVIGIEIDYKAMADLVDSITLYEDGYAFINDAEGNIIYHPHIDVTQLSEENKPKVPSGLLSNDKFIRYTYEGVERQAVWLPLSNGMRLNVTVPMSEINASWQNWVNSIIAIFAVLLIVFIIVILRFTGRITKPLQDLTAAAEQINADNYDFELHYDGNDEVGVLTRAFTQVTSHLKTYISDLNDLAYADALTSVHNKGAFDKYIKDLQMRLNNPNDAPECAVCIFDCNDLKSVNDQYGHAKGDIYLKNACSLICEIFDHSPVFRIGGDEFAVVLLGVDFQNREELIRRFDLESEHVSMAAEESWEKVDVAHGLAVYDAENDASLDDTARRADRYMYDHKWFMKHNRR